ncbi:DMT family transporter [Roseovarius faecimaris]|uniref:DMT family transporter n=1 Tax=Roseovarius faecimaris TaxID=2494550 RepID=A0A6I6IP66_9RHOB|nr:DMT family transporter [Roseovarius faecimaris]QGX98930.1 DMT family transporter [Roseovarius faecimaris]
MDAWIVISVAAAGFQTLRFMLQKTLSMGTLSAGGATFARFLYAAPFALAFAWGVLAWFGADWPALSGLFWVYALTGGLAQILATLCVVLLFAQRNFAVGITFKKTEVIQTVIVGLLVLGDRVSLPGLVAIVIGLVGVLVLSDAPESAARGLRRLANRAAGLGLLSGTFFAISAVAYRGATLEIDSDMALVRSATTLSMVTLSQTLAMAAWLRWREPGELTRVWAARGRAIWMGVTSMAGSLSWFTAFTLQNAAYVFAVGQVEVIFSMLASVLFFKEKITAREYWGIGLLTASILVLVVLG